MISEHIYDLLLDNDYVVVPGLGGFVCQYQSAIIDRQRSVVSPPARTIAFNRALQQNDGLLVQQIVVQDEVSYKDAEEQLRNFVAQCNQQLQQIGSMQFPKIGRLYMDDLKNIQFTPTYDLLPLDDSFGFKTIAFQPISRIGQESEEAASDEKIVSINRTQKRWPYWVAASFASVFLLGSFWMNIGQTSYNDILTAGMFNSVTIHTTSQQHPVQIDNQQIKVEYLSNSVHPQIVEIEAEVESSLVENTVQNYPIVVGAFKGPITAEKLKNRLIEQGYDAQTLVTSPNTFVKVVIHYSAENEEVALATIRENIEKDAWLLN